LYSVTNVSLTQILKFTRTLMQPYNIFQQIILPSSGTELYMVMENNLWKQVVRKTSVLINTQITLY